MRDSTPDDFIGESIQQLRALADSRSELVGEPEPGDDAGRRLYALAARVPMGEADRYSVLEAPSAAARLDVLRDAV